MEKDEKDDWFDHGLEDELVRELLDDESPFFVIQPKSKISEEDATQPLIYPGPRIEDIQNGLSVKTWNGQSQPQHRTRVNSMLERGAITSAGTSDAVQRSRWRGQKMSQIPSSSPMKDFTYTLPTHISLSCFSEAESSQAKDTLEITTLPSSIEMSSEAGFSQQGLLEDLVPWMIRNPSHNNNIASISSSCSSSNSPPASPSHCLGLPMF
ncbi:hypothetical protein F3Y22_tig00110931pilonHSYRG00081 [Hibiscus syriacus]|uniref:Uncharacterized protein n=1 Tax=Hibiscus syriacus TaxID=106335 RepID=A0A6A2ZF93_HIBSY|nr:hypothetical protein F3Y22_tig00110931pilonHSYRG00081 [Hibiscus syriacus]